MKNGIRKYIADNQLFTSQDKLLVAVSGGVDSVVLCQLLYLNGFDFSIAHCNFQLRGEESDGDELFVKTLSEKWDVPFYTQRFETEAYAQTQKISIQLAARDLRYAWFEQLRRTLEFDCIVVAHHASDNVETVLYNFAKGTGLLGLTGIKPKNGVIIRPLLWATKEEILAYAQAENLSFREDSSNDSDKYSRNYIRHHIVPAFKYINPSFESTVVENINHFAEAKDLLDFFIQEIKNKATKYIDNQLFIDINCLKTYPSVSTILFEILKDFGFNATQVTQILLEGETKTGSLFFSPSHKLLIDRSQYILVPLDIVSDAPNSYSISKDDSQIVGFDFKLLWRFEKNNGNLSNPNTNIVQLDADKLLFPLTLRHWQEGDRFQPLGMAGKSQLLSDYFRSKKLSLFEKTRVWILETTDKKICWVVGYRIDDRFKITNESPLSLILEYHAN